MNGVGSGRYLPHGGKSVIFFQLQKESYKFIGAMPTEREDRCMQIVEVIDTLPAGVLPCSYYVLKNATDVKSFHEKLKIPLRHPFSIYTVSLFTIRERMDRLLDLIVPLYTEPQAFKEQYTKLDTEIRDATDSLLDALMEHFDDCENVLDCYLGKESQKLKRKIIKWKSYRDHVGKIVNQIKHQQRRVRTILFYGADWAVPGYFIEGPLPGKIIGPDPLIHPGGETAFSFRRNLLFHLWGLYDASRCLSNGLSMINKRFADIAPTSTTPEKEEEEWYKMICRVEALNPLVFPDEAQKQNIVVTIKDGRLRVEHSSKDKAHTVPSCEVTLLHIVDGMSPNFKVPYYPKH